VRALSVVAAPGLMFAFWLQNQYPQRPLWGRIEDEYFFVMFSFVAMAGVAIFEWEMLFPDRLDFLVLTPLSLREWEMPAAKAIALAMFLGIFLGAANLFGVLMLPGVTQVHLWRQIGAHAVAVSCAGIFGALLVMLLGGVLLCVLPGRWFRSVSLVFRMVAVAALALLVIHYARFGDAMPALLANGGERMRWVPTFWFLGLYQVMQHGSAAPQFAYTMTRRADVALAAVMLGLVVVYPLAWTRMRRLAIEEEVSKGSERREWISGLVHRVIRCPEERAVFHFIGQTMARNGRYHVYMAIYFGAGLALAISCATRVQTIAGVPQATLSKFGLHAVMPLLVFWTVAGVKMAFAFPLQLQARWIFRTTGARLESCVAAVRKWALGCGLSVVFAVMAVLAGMGVGARALAIQAACGVCLCAVLVEGFFFAQTTVPFSQARRPGRTSLPLVLTLYLGVLPPFIFAMVFLEMKIERHWLWLLVAVGLVPVVHWVLGWLRDRSVLVEEEREGSGGEVQLLGVSGELSA